MADVQSISQRKNWPKKAKIGTFEEVIAQIVAVSKRKWDANYQSCLHVKLTHLAMPQRPMEVDMNLSQPSMLFSQ